MKHQCGDDPYRTQTSGSANFSNVISGSTIPFIKGLMITLQADDKVYDQRSDS